MHCHIDISLYLSHAYSHMNQIQIQQENKTLDKARIIAASKRVRRTSNHRIWIVSSQSTEHKFYRIIFDEELDCFVCDCKACEFSMGVCKHILACAIFEGESA